MMLSFLNPWFWLGMLAIAAPIWLHLRRKQETNLVRFSALQFLDDLPTPRRSPLRLRDLLLFALRVLVLLLVVAALAWPYRRDIMPSPVEESRVYILDNTLSHQANAGFSKDRDLIQDEVRGLGNGIQAAVIELTSEPRVVVSFSEDRLAAKRKLQELEPSHQRGSYLAAFRQANALLANSLGRRKRIVFYGDNQENQWTENLNSPPFLQNVEIKLPTIATLQEPNLSLSEPRLQRIFLGEQSLVNLTVKLHHRGEAKSCHLTLRVNDQILVDRSIEVAEEPETFTLQTQWEADPTRWLRGEAAVQGTPDVLAGDNRVFFSLPPVTEGKIALLAQSPYLRLALSPEIMRGHWTTRPLDPSRLSAELLENQDADVLFLEGHYLQSSDARKLVWRYLTNRRGVILCVNRVTPVITGVLRELGFETPSARMASTPADRGFRYVFFNHPIFHPFLSPDYGNLMDVRVSRYTRLKSMEALPLIFSESGDPLLFESTKFPGKLLVSAFGFEREETSWTTHLTFIPFLDLCLQNARAQNTAPIDYEPGQVTLVALPSDSTVRHVSLRDQQRELQRVAVTQNQAQLRLPDKPGLYAVAYDDAAEPAQIFSVNPPPKESELKYVESPAAPKVGRLDSASKTQEPTSRQRQVELTLSMIHRQQFWWWLLVAGLFALVLETAWASSRKGWDAGDTGRAGSFPKSS